jgi:DNA repair protein RadD
MIILRDYQLKAVQELREAIKDGAKNILLVAPTGSGKTVIAAHLIDESNKKFKHSVFVADRINLIDQTYDVFTGYGMRPGVIQSKHPKRDRQARIQIASAQTVSRRSWPKAELIVVDEAHTVYRTVRDRLMPRDTVAIGLTATPFTPGLGKLYDALVNVETTNNLIDGGFLSHYRIFAASAPDMEGVKIVAGEWDEAETSARAMPVVGDCVAEYVKHCQGKKFICSAVDTAHVDELVRQFTAAGIFVASYTYKDTDASRRVTVDEFRKPDSAVKGLVTVSAATKGFDVPDLGCVIMARPLRSSLAEHIQLFGRGLRAHPGKEEVIILDHSGNCERFWSQWQGFFASGASELSMARQRKPRKDAVDEVEFIKCRKCFHLHMPMPFCPACGFEYPKKQSVLHVPGTLSELVAYGNAPLTSKVLWPQIVAYARRHNPGKAEGYALALYRRITDQWPVTPFKETVPADIISPEVRNKILSFHIAWGASQRGGAA